MACKGVEGESQADAALDRALAQSREKGYSDGPFTALVRVSQQAARQTAVVFIDPIERAEPRNPIADAVDEARFSKTEPIAKPDYPALQRRRSGSNATCCGGHTVKQQTWSRPVCQYQNTTSPGTLAQTNASMRSLWINSAERAYQ